jgi:transcriptional regulator with XRE-family HTH domain
VERANHEADQLTLGATLAPRRGKAVASRALPALRSRRISLGLSQLDVAHKAAVSVPLISMVERRRCRTSAVVQAAIAAALVMPVEALFEPLECRPARSEKVQKNCETCGRPFSVVPSAAGRRRHCSRSCLLADPHVAQSSRNAQDRIHGNLCVSLLAQAGGCGSPACRDLSCAVPHGECHRKGCTNPTARAQASRRERRHVKGHPARLLLIPRSKVSESRSWSDSLGLFVVCEGYEDL